MHGQYLRFDYPPMEWAKVPDTQHSLYLCLAFYLQIEGFREWAMLGSNQRPLPCEGSAMVCWMFLELA
jgi:hypothetical protein